MFTLEPPTNVKQSCVGSTNTFEDINNVLQGGAEIGTTVKNSIIVFKFIFQNKY